MTVSIDSSPMSCVPASRACSASISAATSTRRTRAQRTTTSNARDAVAGQRHADESGGLSGRPLRDQSTAVVRALAKALDGALPIIGVGGIFSGADAREKIDAGATLIQLYTGLVYRGPGLV